MLNWLKKGTPSGKNLEAITSTPVLQLSQEHSSEHSKKSATRYFALNAGHFIKYKWLLKDSHGKLFCKPCRQFPELSKQSDKFVKGWAGNNQGFKDESFARHASMTNHKECAKKYETEVTSLTNTIAPEVNQWSRHLLCATHVVQSSEPSYCF